MGIWLELGIFGLVLVFAFWQMHDVRKAQERTRQQRALEKDREAAQPPQEESPPQYPSTIKAHSSRQGPPATGINEHPKV